MCYEWNMLYETNMQFYDEKHAIWEKHAILWWKIMQYERNMQFYDEKSCTNYLKLKSQHSKQHVVAKQMTLFSFEGADSIITQLDHVYEFGPHHTGSSYSAV